MRKDFEQVGYTRFLISDYFPYFKFLPDELKVVNEDYWSYIIKNEKGTRDFYLTESNLEQIDNEKQLAFKNYEEGKFSFSFKRLPDNEISCQLPFFCEVKNLVSSELFISFLTSEIGRHVGKLSLMYFNRFDKNDFLSTHCDSGNNIGLVINLTQMWDVNHGGLTFVLDERRKNIVDVFSPSNLEAWVFDTRDKKIPHFVSMVTATQKLKRMALVIRYD